MSLSDILGTATSGLNASQAGLSSVSNNIANVRTPGYARQQVTTSTNVTPGGASGVRASEPERVADRYLESAVYRRGGEDGRTDALSSVLDRIQSFLGAPAGSNTDSLGYGVPKQLDTLIGKATLLTGSQNPRQYSNAFVLSAQDFLQGVGGLGGDIGAARADVASGVSSTVNRINTLLRQIDDDNGQIVQLQHTGRSISGLADQRQTALQELSGLVDVTVSTQPNGRVTVETATGQPLLDDRLRQLDYPGGEGGANAIYPTIGIRFADPASGPGFSTGQSIDSAAVGGRLGGLLQLRDVTLPNYLDQIADLANQTGASLNAASNDSTTAPAPQTLTGRPSGLTGADQLHFTGKSVFAVTARDGTVLARTVVDFDALGSGATVDDAVRAINAGLGGKATAALDATGTLSLTANVGGAGVVVAQDPTTPGTRGGKGFAQYFGLNDLVRVPGNPLVPSGMQASDPTGFAAGQTAHVVLRTSDGRELAGYTINGQAGQTFGSVVAGLNASMGAFGSFAIGNDGRIGFTPSAAAGGVSVQVDTDSTDRLGTGVSFTALSGLTGAAARAPAALRGDIVTDSGRLPLGRFDVTAIVGSKGIGTGDVSGAALYVDALSKTQDRGAAGKASIANMAADLFGRIGTDAAQASTGQLDAAARRDEAIQRRDTFSGVNVDEELANMVVLQNSYSAAARVLTTASDMYQTLIDMVR